MQLFKLLLRIPRVRKAAQLGTEWMVYQCLWKASSFRLQRESMSDHSHSLNADFECNKCMEKEASEDMIVPIKATILPHEKQKGQEVCKIVAWRQQYSQQ